MRILIFILALMSAFFVPATFSVELDLDDLREPKTRTERMYKCVFNFSWGGSTNTKLTSQSYAGAMDSCKAWAFVNLERSQPCGTSQVNDGGYGRVLIPLNLRKTDGSCVIGGQGGGDVNFTAYDEGVTEQKTCPPDNSPEHKFDYIDSNGDLKCAKLKEYKDCDAGYHSKSASAALGSDSCLPKDCPAAGSNEHLYASPHLNVPFSGGGMYCNDGCAYVVHVGNINGPKNAYGTSQGVACGDKPYDNKKLADEDDLDKCATATNSDGVSVLSCPTPDPSSPPKEHDNDEQKEDSEGVVEKPILNCDPSDSDCLLENIVNQLQNNLSQSEDTQKNLHNKKIEADVNNTNKITSALLDIETQIVMHRSENGLDNAITHGKLQGIIDAINNKPVGGGGGGTGSTGGNIGGEDCLGTPEDCVDFGGNTELEHETRNLEQYAQKYNNWLPNAELPPEKCITLTNGKSLCFSFQYFIVFFQAISGLIVLSSLIHSASIIVRSV